MNTKKCSRCGLEKTFDQFHKNAKNKDGLRAQCKACRNGFYKNNKTRLDKYQKTYYINNKEYICEKQKKYKKPSLSRYKKGLCTQQQYEKYRNRRNKNEIIKRKTNPSYRFRKNVSRSIRQAMNRQGSKKDYKTFQMLPYSPQDLKEHIENHFDEKMNWDNYGDYWHLDHIIPQAALPYRSLEDENFQKCWALENLRPLEAIENISKGSLYEGERHKYSNEN